MLHQAWSRTCIRGRRAGVDAERMVQRLSWWGTEEAQARPGCVCGEKWEGLESIWRSSQQEWLRVR